MLVQPISSLPSIFSGAKSDSQAGEGVVVAGSTSLRAISNVEDVTDDCVQQFLVHPCLRLFVLTILNNNRYELGAAQ